MSLQCRGSKNSPYTASCCFFSNILLKKKKEERYPYNGLSNFQRYNSSSLIVLATKIPIEDDKITVAAMTNCSLSTLTSIDTLLLGPLLLDIINRVLGL
uniref:Uncharacterized protein n=1 Tax=Pyxicephalus adspersus TaxID=30357 RepID=A0AAV3A593_PYXAD|nr:TPA: hypothetical protein GDO54_018222 [Pyxicephalus adspersus]